MPRRASRSAPLFGLAPDGVCRAKPVTRPAGELLPRRFTLTSGVTQASRPRRSIFCGTVPIRAAHRGTERWALPTIAPCGVRTFLRGTSPDPSRRTGFPAMSLNPGATAIIAPATNLIFIIRASPPANNSHGAANPWCRPIRGLLQDWLPCSWGLRRQARRFRPVRGFGSPVPGAYAARLYDFAPFGAEEATPRSSHDYGLTTATARSSTSSRPSIMPRIVRVAGTVGWMPTPWCREPSCLSTFMPVHVT